MSQLTIPRPASTYWEIFKYISTAKCLNIKAIYYFHSGQNTFSDFVIFLWPAKDLLNVQISLRQRITLTCMFSLGVMYVSFLLDVLLKLIIIRQCMHRRHRAPILHTLVPHILRRIL
jgi:hypothetical protein